MATPHHPGTTAPPARSPRPRPRLRRVVLLTVALAVGLSAPPPLPASAAPGGAAARDARDALAAEVSALERRVAEAETTLERLTIEAEAASDVLLRAQAELEQARSVAEERAAALADARAAADATQDDVAALGREAYMGEDAYGGAAVLLDADGPRGLLQRAATLELLGEERSRTLEALEVVERREVQADRAARGAVTERDGAARAAAGAEAEVRARLDDAQATFDAVTAERAVLDERLRRAEIELLALEGAPDPAAAQQQRRASAAAARQAFAGVPPAGPGGVALTRGRVTSCYGPRWGTVHQGVDIAAPIGTPIQAADAGVVLEAGPASGFGLAVYVQHADGSITLYGHVDRFFVSAGQVVAAGQVIAEVGNRGQSTGPHLHFEVHEGGLYADRTDPVPWLAARGISLGGRCG
ncbi:M23 family metallopeptidase [Geodermatophilus sp. YIM 151500]|uniref:M23 family metallopeptidase n=1 Tax=Geodermatophilus sp. YIM 151500 TaxID=2984531 RepID=UPI0021E35AE4|nr:M23 family metallopeptidase [Geodermatophilus sp. YIM 151500]MCV2489935.1 M23 family metallopeptidase [Geodermatophilus sp. YIM 151500]